MTGRTNKRRRSETLTPAESSVEDFDSEVFGDGDADEPRIVQWVDEDDMEPEDSSGLEEDSDDKNLEPDISQNLNSLRQDMSLLPFGSLRQAQAKINKSRHSSPSSSDSEDSGSGEPSTSKQHDWNLRSRSDIPRRSNKHAPTEVTSKRPVTRTRLAVDSAAPVSRDPRFLSLTGEFSPSKHQSNYRFLSDSRQTELQTLRSNLKTARKRLSSVPKHARVEAEQEIGRLQLAINRAESQVNQDKRAKVEQEALKLAAGEEKERRKQGKAAWWPKKSAQKDLLTKARYEHIAQEGGQQAVKKAIEKKQKKVNQKEKRSRPRIDDGTRPFKRKKIE